MKRNISMKEFFNTSQTIRNYINDSNKFDSYRNDIDGWMSLCAGMDILEDSSRALSHYERYGIGKNIDGQYLKLYGFLQAIILQQESVKQLYYSLLGNELKNQDGSAWGTIRSLRNITIGHPIKKEYGGKNNPDKIKRCFISQPDLKKDSIVILVWDKVKNNYEIKHINLKQIYYDYKVQTYDYLNEILESISVPSRGLA